MKRAKLDELARAMTAELRISEIPDYSGAWNGLQLANASGEVGRVAAAVDASLPVVEAAVASGADLLLVHHGMFWSGVPMVTGSTFRKLKTAMDHNLAIFSVHLPLDVHPTLGNNVGLARACDLPEGKPFGEWKGLPLGLRFEVEMDRDDLSKRICRAVSGGRVHLCPGGPERIRAVGIVTGGAGAEVSAVAAAGIDAFITGEGPHWSYTLAEELGVNVFYAGHYATETFGVKSLAAWLEAQFGLPWQFIDHPTGM